MRYFRLLLSFVFFGKKPHKTKRFFVAVTDGVRVKNLSLHNSKVKACCLNGIVAQNGVGGRIFGAVRLLSACQLKSDPSHGYDGNAFVSGEVFSQLCNKHVQTA